MPFQVFLHFEGFVHELLVFGAEALVCLRKIVELFFVVDHTRLDSFACLILLFQFLFYEVLLLSQLVQLFPRLVEHLAEVALFLLLVCEHEHLRLFESLLLLAEVLIGQIDLSLY